MQVPKTMFAYLLVYVTASSEKSVD